MGPIQMGKDPSVSQIRPPAPKGWGRIHQYHAMVRLCWGKLVDEIPTFFREVDIAKKILRRHDRVVWYLQLRQRSGLCALVRALGDSGLTKAQARRHRYLINKFGTPWFEKDGDDGIKFLKAWNRAEILAHEVPLVRSALDRFELDQFKQFAIAQKSVELLTEDYWMLAVHQRHVEDLITFENGWKWVHCLYGGSPWEAKFMHHCGNLNCQDPHVRILSLREPVSCGGLTLWKPHLTFTTRFGMVIEMKGRENKKPSSTYYAYIRKLFLDYRINGLSSQLGSLPCQDLEWSDLPVEMRAEIETKRYFVFHYGRDQALKELRNPKRPKPAEEAPRQSLWDRFADRFPAAAGVSLIMGALASVTLLPYLWFLAIRGVVQFLS